jgi:hypothetical protein
MSISSVPAVRTQAIIGLSVFVIGIWVAWQLGSKIAVEDLRTLEYAALTIGGIAVAITTLRDWRKGFYVFFVWLLFEDLVRKFLGNNLAIYFGKDALVAIVYIAFFVEVRRGNVKLFNPRFLLFFYPCLLLCIAGMMNPYSPSFLYGLMGLKLNFYYLPLMFVGYGLIRNDEDLRRFLAWNLVLALVIGGLGITQAIVGNTFLNPTNIAPELRDLGEMDRVTPVTGQVLAVPASVFVSAGRYSQYLTLMFILAYGTAGYILLHTDKSRRLAYLCLGGVIAATMFCGARGAVAYMGISIVALTGAFLWGAPWRWRQAHRMIKAIARAFLIGAAAAVLITLIFPAEIAPRVAFYVESLDPNSTGYEVGNRTWDYPIRNLEAAIEQPTWMTGIGLGTASLGTQYVAKILKQPPIEVWVEEGYGQLILEMGILAPFLWILWTGALLYYCIRITSKLRQTRFFPIACAITWYAFLLLFPFTYGGLSPYQNFVDNAYFWILIGIINKLPLVNEMYPNAPEALSRTARVPITWARPHAPQFQ